jgi:2-keto-4-pentenoate hydratase
MTPEARQQAAQHFWQHLDSGQRIVELPDAQRPKTEAEGHAIQVAFAEHSSQPIAGWKIAATSKAGQQHLAIDGPLAGRVLMEQRSPLSLGKTCLRKSSLIL